MLGQSIYVRNIVRTLETSTPVSDLTNSGIFVIISKTSPVNLAAPVSPLDVTMVIFFVLAIGVATSWAICVMRPAQGIKRGKSRQFEL